MKYPKGLEYSEYLIIICWWRKERKGGRGRRREKGRKKQKEGRKEKDREAEGSGKEGRERGKLPSHEKENSKRFGDLIILNTHVTEENTFLGRRSFNHYDSFPQHSSSFHVCSYSRKGMKALLPFVSFFPFPSKSKQTKSWKVCIFANHQLTSPKILYSISGLLPRALHSPHFLHKDLPRDLIRPTSGAASLTEFPGPLGGVGNVTAGSPAKLENDCLWLHMRIRTGVFLWLLAVSVPWKVSVKKKKSIKFLLKSGF